MRRVLPLLLPVFLLGGCLDLPGDASKHRPVRQSTASFTPSPQGRQCLSELGATQANFSPVPDRYFDDGCTNLNAVRISALRGDYHSLSIANLGPVTCPMANTFAAWARFGVDRAARQILGSPLVRIETMGSYNCRNVAGTGRRSGHATANAIDVAGFILADGRTVSVLDGWNEGSADERRFLRIVHESACKRFGMVLGPAYNGAHKDHFHVEQKTGSFCR